MQCKECGIEMDADVYAGTTEPDCVFCGGRMKHTSTDYLSMPELGLVSEVRPTQLALAEQLQTVIKEKQHAIIEAGTGVGKSFAYLLTAILTGKRVVITTAKKSLQSQLIEKDLPRLQELLGPELTFAPAYGKGNYGCRRAASKSPSHEDKKAFEAFFNYAPTWNWDEADEAFSANKKANKSLPLYNLPRDHWRYSAKECVGRECDYFKNKTCEYIHSRERVSHSKVVVTNHWLLGYDVALRTGVLGDDTSSNGLLGDYHVLIVDEGHKFEDGFRTAFTLGVDEHFLKRTLDKYGDDLDKSGEEILFPREKELRIAWSALFRKLDKTPGKDTSTEVSASYLGNEGSALLKEVQRALARAHSTQFLNALFSGDGAAIHKYLTVPNSALPMSVGSRGLNLLFAHKKAINALVTVQDLLINAYSSDDNFVTYLEKGDERKPNALNVAPVRMSGHLQSLYKRLNSVVYISATLAVGGTFDDFTRRVGLNKPEWKSRINTGLYGSAFDYDKQAVLYLSPNVPQATYKQDEREAYRDKLAEEIWDLVHAANGCAFVLFTSRVEMNHVHDYMIRKGITLPLLRQTPGIPASALLQRFRTSTSPVLLGLKSFWEGIDVQGEQLQLVCITKLPFPGRSDPIVVARREREGNSWFSRVDLPDMILDLRQGVGRLIRSTSDKGVVAILDQRLLTKRYKNQALKSLGFNNITKNKKAVVRALQNLAKAR